MYGDLVFRSIDTPVPAATPEETCDAPFATGSGLEVFRLEDRSVRAKAEKVNFLNPQTLIWEIERDKKMHRRS